MSPEGGKATQTLSGLWHGRYAYPLRLPPVSFEAILFESGMTVTGTVSEPSVMHDGTVADATLLGDHEGSAVSFVKTYADAGRYPHPVRYSGTLSADGTEIEGRWRISWYWSGTFLMIRSPREAVAVSRKAEERV